MKPSPSVDLFHKPPRKLVPLTLAQAYSRVFCQKASPLYKELRREWKLHKLGDDTTIKKYQHLFPSTHRSKLPFVAFQQTIFRDTVTRITDEELNTLQEFIDARFEEETELRERPWNASKVDEAQSEVDLERQYISV